MKKALVLLLALSMVFGAFADEPVANVNVSEFSGNASVTWGVDLDSGKTGFKNATEATLKLNLLDGGNASTKGEGVWGEIKIKTDGDTFLKFDESGMNAPSTDIEFEEEDGEITGLESITINSKANLFALKLKVDKALLHFGENAYVGIKSGDTQVGEYKLQTAIANEKTKNANKGDDSYTQGIVAGYGNDMFSVDVDFRSSKDAQYTNQYGLGVDAALKAVDNLTFKAGYSKDFECEGDWNVTDAFYVATDYKLGLNDTFYVKPQVGFAMDFANNDRAIVNEVKTKVKESTGDLAAAILLGWGDVADKKPGVYFIDGDDDKKVIPGISVAMTKQVVYSKEVGDDKTKGLESPTTLKVAFFSGEIVENLTAAAYYETTFGKEKTKTGDVESDGDEYDGYSFAAGLKYKLAVGEGSITPQFGIAMANNEKNVKANEKQIQWSDKNPKDGEILNIKAGVEFAGYVENTTFTVVYASDNLKADDSTGTLNFTCKIAL